MLTNAKTMLLCGALIATLAVSRGFTATLHVDPNDETAFQTIQEAIDSARNFDTVIVHPGIYVEAISFKTRAITVRSVDPNDLDIIAATIIDGNGNTVVAFEHGEGENSILLGLTIQNGRTGIRCAQDYARPQIRKCIITSNEQDGIIGGTPTIVGCTIAQNDGDGVASFSGHIHDCTILTNAGNGIECRWGADVRITGCVISNNGANGIKCESGAVEVENCLLSANAQDGVNGASGLRKVHNCTIVWNDDGVNYGGIWTSTLSLSNSILAYNRRYGLYRNAGTVISNSNNVYANGGTDYGNASAGEQDIQRDPLFADNGYFAVDGTWHNGDYHLMSTVGRWDPVAEEWVTDPVDSPCLDKGDPNSPIGAEPHPHGGRINLGVYGGTAEASKSEIPDSIPAACIEYPEMDFNRDCKVDQADLDIFLEHWLECNLDDPDACWPDGPPPEPQVQLQL